VAAALALSSCEIHPPSFLAASARLYVEPGPGGTRVEKLSFFASVRDEDGAGDLEYLYLVHDGSELAWTLDAGNWIRRDEGQATWFGSNGLSRPDGGSLPRGEWRALAVDLAGERAEWRFTLSAPDTADRALPSLALAGEDAVILSSSYPVNAILFLDAGGNVVKTADAAVGRNPLDALFGSGLWRSGADYLAAYGLDPRSDTGYFSWKIRLPD